MTTTPTLVDRDRLYVGGQWVEPAAAATRGTRAAGVRVRPR